MNCRPETLNIDWTYFQVFVVHARQTGTRFGARDHEFLFLLERRLFKDGVHEESNRNGEVI
jgi:hypothetical protein